MNRQEFIEKNQKCSRGELLEIASNLRKKAESRIPKETEAQFRSLDKETAVEEKFVTTVFGNTHVFLVKSSVSGKDLRPTVLNVHGGGWSLPHGERDIYFSRRLAAHLNCLVADVDYVLAPEYPYPAALEEIEALLDVLPGELPKWGGDPDKVIFCGQSSGGNLLGGVSQRKKYTEKLHVMSQILAYLPADNYSDHFRGGELDERAMGTEYYGFFYNQNFEERKNPDVSLVYAPEEMLACVPPTDILVCGWIRSARKASGMPTA